MMDTPHAKKMMAYDASKKDVLLAYIIWFFLGSFGLHRIYMGKVFSGIMMGIIHIISWILTIVVIGFAGLAFIGLWWVIDAFLIIGWVERYNLRLANYIG